MARLICIYHLSIVNMYTKEIKFKPRLKNAIYVVSIMFVVLLIYSLMILSFAELFLFFCCFFLNKFMHFKISPSVIVEHHLIPFSLLRRISEESNSFSCFNSFQYHKTIIHFPKNFLNFYPLKLMSHFFTFQRIN